MPQRPLAFSFALTSFFAVCAGCVVASLSGAPLGTWGRNVAAWVIGGMLMLLLKRIRPALLFPAMLLVTPLFLLASLFSPGQEDVHRWMRLGPLNLNMAFFWLPSATVAIAGFAQNSSRWPWLAALIIQVLLCLQPDASQATAFAAAILTTLLTARYPAQARVLTGIVFVLAAGFSWTRPDPLLPVPEVEGIITLARTISFGLAILCITLLAAASASPFIALKNSQPARSLSVYFFTCALMPLLGAFPVPLVGMGMSPIIGSWLAIGTLIAAATARTAPDYSKLDRTAAGSRLPSGN